MSDFDPAAQEKRDAELVDQAAAAIAEERPAPAERLLLDVVSRTPTPYVNIQLDAAGELQIKFWDVQDFLHYIHWHEQQGGCPDIVWIKNAYPRAYYYLGFLGVRNKTYPQAIDYLRRGQQLDPTHPRFHLELGQALIRLGDLPAALAQYDEVGPLGPYVGARDVAMARRGKGFVLIEMGRLDEAEAEFRASLDYQPGNEIAMSELDYIDNLRLGGVPTHTESVPVGAPDIQECIVCNRPTARGKLVMFQGFARTVCESCAPILGSDEDSNATAPPSSTEANPARRWWEFWK